jgi:hypothetical protein
MNTITADRQTIKARPACVPDGGACPHMSATARRPRSWRDVAFEVLIYLVVFLCGAFAGSWNADVASRSREAELRRQLEEESRSHVDEVLSQRLRYERELAGKFAEGREAGKAETARSVEAAVVARVAKAIAEIPGVVDAVKGL